MEIENLLDQFKDVYNNLNEKKETANSYKLLLDNLKQEILLLEKDCAIIQQNIAIEMVNNGIIEEPFGDYVVKPKKLPDLVVIDDESLIDESFVNTKTVEKKSIDKSKIKEALKRQEEIKGAYMISDRYSLAFKMKKIN